MSDDKELLITAERVSKKFCRSLKRSLFYGIHDMGCEMLGLKTTRSKLRKNEFWAVKDICFELRRGECLGLIGANGAGKSTLLKMLTGLIFPDEGKITVRGKVGALIELGAGFNPILSGRENIYVNGSILGFTKKQIDYKLDKIVEFAELSDFIDMPVQNYSSGMKVRLGFAVAAQMEPDVLFIDEVLAVGDIGFSIKCLNEISRMLKHSAVIFVSHSMPLVARVCTEVMLLDHGKNEWCDRDIGTGISKYLAKFSAGKRSTGGSGKVSLESIKLTIPNNPPSHERHLTLRHGQDLAIELKVKKHADISKMAFTVVIWNQEMRAVADSKSALQGFFVCHEGNEFIVSATLKNLQLTSGLYSLQVHVSDDREDEIYTNVQNAAIFQVITPFPGSALFRLSAEWQKLS